MVTRPFPKGARAHEPLTGAGGHVPAQVLDQTPAKQGQSGHGLAQEGRAEPLPAPCPHQYLRGLSVWCRATQAAVAGLQAQ